MVVGDWTIKMTGRGKIHPADADEIQQMIISFHAQLIAAGHEIKSMGVKKFIGGEEP